MTWTIRPLSLLLFTIALSGSGFAQRDINRRNVNFTSIEKEIAIGRQLAQEIERQVKLLDDATINEYVNRLGQNIARNSDSQIPMTVKVVDSSELNGLSLPGGFVYVNAGAIVAAGNEAELASLIAYQIAHVAARHSTEMAARADLLNGAGIPVVFAASSQTYAESPAAISVPQQFVQFQRRDVEEADNLGVQYLYKTGYEPGAAVSMLRKVPAGADRIKLLQQAIEGLLPRRPQQQNIVTTDEFQSIRKRATELAGTR